MRSLIVAALTAAITAGWEAIEIAVSSGGKFDWMMVGRAALVAGAGYLIKNLFIEPTKVISTPAPDSPITAETVQSVVQHSLNPERDEPA